MPQSGVGGLLGQAGGQVNRARRVLHSLSAVPHHRAEKIQIRGWERPTVHGRLSGRGLWASIGILDLRNTKCCGRRHKERDANQTFVQQQAVSRLLRLQRGHIGTWTVRAVIRREDRIHATAGIESCLDVGWGHAHRIAGDMACATAPTIGSKALKERVRKVDSSSSAVCAQGAGRMAGVERVGQFATGEQSSC